MTRPKSTLYRVPRSHSTVYIVDNKQNGDGPSLYSNRQKARAHARQLGGRVTMCAALSLEDFEPVWRAKGGFSQ